MSEEKRNEENKELSQEEMEKLSGGIGAKCIQCPKCMSWSFYPDSGYCWTCKYSRK